MIEVSGLTKLYSGIKAVDNLSFKMAEGEIVGLLGLNGAGKTTVLKVLGCYLLPSHGTVTINGKSTTTEPHQVRELIGYLPDVPPLYDEMTVDSYLSFVAKLKNVSRNLIRQRIEDVVSKTNLESVRTKRLGNLSHGFQQRVGIAQALVHNPAVVILDEPINGLDPVQIVEMRDLILGLKGHHTVILSSHILSEVTKTCDRILVIDQGKLIAEGDESKLYNSVKRETTVKVELLNSSDHLIDKIRSIEGVKTCAVETQQECTSLFIETEKDVRSEIARCIVNNDGQLLSLNKEGDGLESIFLQMVRSH